MSQKSELQLSSMVHIHYFSYAKCISRKLLRVNIIFHKTINIFINVEKFVIFNFTRALCGVVQFGIETNVSSN